MTSPLKQRRPKSKVKESFESPSIKEITIVHNAEDKVLLVVGPTGPDAE